MPELIQGHTGRERAREWTGPTDVRDFLTAYMGCWVANVEWKHHAGEEPVQVQDKGVSR